MYLGDIIIERWLPYEQQTARRTIIQRAPPAIEYAQPCCSIVIYGGYQKRIVRKFERLDITNADPKNYVALYGSSLLPPTTLVQTAHNAGVMEDIVNVL